MACSNSECACAPQCVCVPSYTMVPQIGAPAPSFNVQALMPDLSFKNLKLADFTGKWLVILFYPLDWTFVCPTEIVAYNDALPRFEKINANVVAASVDSVYSHLSWVKTDRKQGGLGRLSIPILSDITHRLSQDYGVMYKDTGHTLRALFIIDPTGILRHFTFNDVTVGRNTDETLRLISAYQYTDLNGEVCPANWNQGGLTMKPHPEHSREYFGQV